MKNKQHEYILRAFLDASIPTVIRRSSPQLMVTDSVIGGVLLSIDKASQTHRTPIKRDYF